MPLASLSATAGCADAAETYDQNVVLPATAYITPVSWYTELICMECPCLYGAPLPVWCAPACKYIC